MKKMMGAADPAFPATAANWAGLVVSGGALGPLGGMRNSWV